MNMNRVTAVPDRVSLKNALVSTADKKGLDRLLPKLWEQAPQLRLFSTGGTYQTCRQIARTIGRENQVIEVSAYTGQPEMQGGLVKTLDWKIYLGLLSEPENIAHDEDLRNHGAVPFDLVICNFYPFEQAVLNRAATLEDARAHIDIGGPTMVRAAAKNFIRIALLTAPQQYGGFVATTQNGESDLATRYTLAQEAFLCVRDYDTAIAAYLSSKTLDALNVYKGID